MTRLVSLLTALSTLAGASLAREIRLSETAMDARTTPTEGGSGSSKAQPNAYHYNKPQALPGADATQGDLYDYWSTLVGKEAQNVSRLGTCPKPNPAALSADLEASEGSHVKKTVFDGPTLLYVAGLEGAGHHFWMTMHNGTLQSAPSAVDNAIRELMTARRMLCGAKGSAATDCHKPDPNWLDEERANMKHALEEFKSMPKGVYSAGAGFWSYPFHRDGPRAIFEHPDVGLLAELAEEAGVDMRFLVTTRNADSMLQSDVAHRHFCAGDDGMERQADYLAHNARVLKTQLQRLDPRFFRHTSFDDLPKVADDLSAFYETKLSLPPGAWHDRAQHMYTRHSKHVTSFISNENTAYMNDLREANDDMVRIAKLGRFAEDADDTHKLIAEDAQEDAQVLRQEHLVKQHTA